MPKTLVGRRCDLDDTRITHDIKLRRAERQLERGHTKAVADLRAKTPGLHAVALGCPVPAGEPGEAGAVPPLGLSL